MAFGNPPAPAQSGGLVCPCQEKEETVFTDLDGEDMIIFGVTNALRFIHDGEPAWESAE
jgi:hypothetical protein